MASCFARLSFALIFLCCLGPCSALIESRGFRVMLFLPDAHVVAVEKLLRKQKKDQS